MTADLLLEHLKEKKIFSILSNEHFTEIEISYHP